METESVSATMEAESAEKSADEGSVAHAPKHTKHSNHSKQPKQPTASAPAIQSNEDDANRDQADKSNPNPLNKLYAITVALTADEMIKTLDQKFKPPDTSDLDPILINDILANLDCGEVKPEKPAESGSRTREELLSILEGKDTEPEPAKSVRELNNGDAKRLSRTTVLNPELERSAALKQLGELDSNRRKTSKTFKILNVPNVNIPKNNKRNKKNASPQNLDSDATVHKEEKMKNLAFLDDWADEENPECGSVSSANRRIKPAEKETTILNDIISKANAGDTLANGRVSRVIKKKIIWDPDNPATYKICSSVPLKSVSPKMEDSPEMVKQYKNSSQLSPPEILNGIRLTPGKKKKKMSEIDKLLMDEGAVNMIYQLERSQNNANVPEIELKPNKKSLISINKERRNLINKAKIIKNAVISIANPDNESGIKTFRVRKDSNNKSQKVQNKSTPRSSIHSPLPSEISVTDSVADESRIIRRHSSSSFSSDCFSPGPLSPSESLPNNVRRKNSNAFSNDSISNNNIEKDSNKFVGNESDKRKRKISDVKRIFKRHNFKKIIADPAYAYTQLSMHHIDTITHIILKPLSNLEGLFDCKVLEELSIAVNYASSQKTRVLVLTSDDGIMCGGLDLRSIVQTQTENQRANANELLDNLRELVMELCKFKGIIITGVDGPCCGLGVTLLSLADLAIASDRATFCIAPASRRHLPPEGSVLLKISQTVPAQLIREMIFCGRKLTAADALQRGLIARMIWPDRFIEELLEVAKEVAQYPSQALETTKSILRYTELATVEEAIHNESILLSEYWCSPEGQSAIQAAYSHL